MEGASVDEEETAESYPWRDSRGEREESPLGQLKSRMVARPVIAIDSARTEWLI